MDSSDEDFLPDPDKAFRNPAPLEKKKPPDRTENQQRGQKRKLKEDFNKGKCFLFTKW